MMDRNNAEENYLSEKTWLDLKRLSSWSLSDDGDGIFHPHGVASMLGGRGLQACSTHG